MYVLTELKPPLVYWTKNLIHFICGIIITLSVQKFKGDTSSAAILIDVVASSCSERPDAILRPDTSRATAHEKPSFDREGDG